MLALGFAERATMTGVPGCTVFGEEGLGYACGQVIQYQIHWPGKAVDRSRRDGKALKSAARLKE